MYRTIILKYDKDGRNYKMNCNCVLCSSSGPMNLRNEAFKKHTSTSIICACKDSCGLTRPSTKIVWPDMRTKITWTITNTKSWLGLGHICLEKS